MVAEAYCPSGVVPEEELTQKEEKAVRKKFAMLACAGLMFTSAVIAKHKCVTRANWGDYHEPHAFSKFSTDALSVVGALVGVSGACLALKGVLCTCAGVAAAVAGTVSDSDKVSVMGAVGIGGGLFFTLVGALKMGCGYLIYDLGRDWRESFDADDAEYQKLLQELLAEIEEAD